MRAILLAISIFIFCPAVAGDETRVIEIVDSLDCHVTEMGKGISRLRELTDMIDSDSAQIQEWIVARRSAKNIAKDVLPIFERGKAVEPEYLAIKDDLAKGLLGCGYTPAVQSELLRIMPAVSGRDDLLTRIEMLASASSFATDEWDRQLRRFDETAVGMTGRLRTISKWMREHTDRIRKQR